MSTTIGTIAFMYVTMRMAQPRPLCERKKRGRVEGGEDGETERYEPKIQARRARGAVSGQADCAEELL